MDSVAQTSQILVEPHLIGAEFRKAWMPFFCRSGHPLVTVDQFLSFVGPFLPQEDVLELPRITGQDLLDVARAKRSSAGGLDGWAWNETMALPLPWFSGLAILLGMIEATGAWCHGLLDAYIAMISRLMVTPLPCATTPLGQRPLSVLPVVYRLWASLGLGHLKDWVQLRVPQSVFSLSVEAWFSTAVDIEEVLSCAGGDQLYVMVADVFDTVDMSVLDCALGRLGLPSWFRKVHFTYHSGLGEPWTRDGASSRMPS